MKLIEASYEILPSHGHTLPDIYKDIERAGRTCYKSENKITEDSADSFSASWRMRWLKYIQLISRSTYAFLSNSSLVIVVC